MVWVPMLCLVLSVAVASVAAFTDFRTGHIPNWLTYGAALAGVVLNAVGPEGFVRGTVAAVFGMIVCGVVPYVFYRKDAIGGGDVKLFIALGALLGAYSGIEAQFLAYCAGSLFALARLAWHGRLMAVLANSLFLAVNPVLPKRWRRDIAPESLHRIRFGGAILAGALLSAMSRSPYLLT